MSANINFNKEAGQYAFASAKEVPWHSKGQILDHVMTAKEAVENAHLDYEVEKRKIYTKGKTFVTRNEFGLGEPHQEEVDIPDVYANVRTDTNQPLGIVRSKYRILQNRDAFGFFDSIVGEGEAIYETAGALGKGERVFITAKLPQQIVVAPNDVVDQYLFITNSHDGSGCIKAAFTPVRIVCANTLAMALHQSNYNVNIRHTASMETNLKQAHKLMGIAIAKSHEVEDAYVAMSSVKIKDAELKRFIELAMNPTIEQISEEEYSTQFKNKVNKVLEYAQTDETQLMGTTKGTLYGAFNAITGYYNNVVNYKTADDKINQVLFATGNTVSNRAYDMALEVLANQLKLS